MSRWLYLSFFCASLLHAETITLTMKQAVDRALRENPDVALSRLDELKAAQNVRVAKDPFSPKIVMGSGMAYTNGYPLSVEGSGPTIVQARASQFLYNKSQGYLVAEARENVRAAALATGSKRDEVAFRVVSLFLDADRARRLAVAAAREVDELGRVIQAIGARVEEGRELPIENRRAAVNLLKAKQRLLLLTDDQDLAEHQLAVALGYPPDDRVHASDAERTAPETPASENAAVETALGSNKELKRLDSAMLAKGLEIKSDKASRYPRVDLVAEYGLFSTINHYNQYFRQFQANNGEVGVSFQLPVLPGPGVKAQEALAEGDVARLRIQKNQLQSKITLDIHQAYLEVQKAQSAKELAQADLQLSREQLSLVLAQSGEGRAAMREVEEARFDEEEKWIAFFDADSAVERAKFNVLRETGEIVAALR
jgi:outer membrane protein TolC